MRHIDFSAWYLPEPHPRKNRPNLVIYTACHAWSMLGWFEDIRPDIRAQYNVTAIVVQLVQGQNAWKDPRFLRTFAEADVIFHHNLFHADWVGHRVSDFKLKPSCRCLTIARPYLSCAWPVVVGGGEEPVISLLDSGATVDEIIRIFDAGELACNFPARFESNMRDLEAWDENTDTKCARFMRENWTACKMHSTINHPSFHVYAWIMDQFVGLLGHERRDVPGALSVPVDIIRGDSHYPETAYEFGTYGFTYPRRFGHCLGGSEFYHGQIRQIAAKWDREQVLLSGA